MFSDTQLTAAINAYGTSSSAHVARLIALADMREVEDATVDDIAIAIRHAAACNELGVPFEDTSAATIRAAERIAGFSESTFQRYSIVLGWLDSSPGDSESLSDILANDTFTPDALSALCQLASGKVASRKLASDTVSGHIAKRDSAKIVSAYRRLLAANNAKKKSKNERAARTTTTTAETAERTAETAERTAEQILGELTIPAMADILLARIASSVEDLTPEDYAALVDTMAAIGAMLDEDPADN